jgi:hypothetical protein
MTTPNVAPATQILYGKTGPWADADVTQTLLAWLDGPGQILQVLDTLVREQPGIPGWGTVLDVDLCPDYALPWLAQFVGVRFDSLTETAAAQRTAIRAQGGFSRGTVASLQLAAKKYLKATKTVTITERTPGPYELTVTVLGAEVVGMRYNELIGPYPTYTALAAAFPTYAGFTSAAGDLLAALQAGKPAGLRLTLVIA